MQEKQENLSGDNQNTTEQGLEKDVVTFEIVSNLVSAPAFSDIFGPEVFLSSLPNYIIVCFGFISISIFLIAASANGKYHNKL